MGKITKDKFDGIKNILESIPKGTRGVGELYKTLGISPATAYNIRNSATYKDYKDLIREQMKVLNGRKEAKAETSPTPDVDTNSDSTIMEKLDEILENTRKLTELLEKSEDPLLKWLNK